MTSIYEYDMPDKLLKAHFDSNHYCIAQFLVDDGFKSTKWSHDEVCWQMDDAEYTWFILRWS